MDSVKVSTVPVVVTKIDQLIAVEAIVADRCNIFTITRYISLASCHWELVAESGVCRIFSRELLIIWIGLSHMFGQKQNNATFCTKNILILNLLAKNNKRLPLLMS